MAKSETTRTRSPKAAVDDAREFAAAAAQLAADLKIIDVQILDLRGLSSLADYFVVGTGRSDRQMHSVLDKLEEQAIAMGRKPFKVSD
ncbi:MAG: RsfS/YbeB/iojap family protein, partial [Planctomycetes bacterium]|nr:RsfS/YbeB/iojap family protein [Planctomycetota bacterium]